MDPNACVRKIYRGLTNLVHAGGYSDGEELIEDVENLLDWVDKEGVFPDDEATGDIFASLWFALYDCHGGQTSQVYSLACRWSNYYTPGPSTVHVEEEGGEVEDLYKTACELLVPGSYPEHGPGSYPENMPEI
tara:strand:+ start:2349 stop:2747 length:399 start_codon:yes stop_codon:yes gene_type:complete